MQFQTRDLDIHFFYPFFHGLRERVVRLKAKENHKCNVTSLQNVWNQFSVQEFLCNTLYQDILGWREKPPRDRWLLPNSGCGLGALSVDFPDVSASNSPQWGGRGWYYKTETLSLLQYNFQCCFWPFPPPVICILVMLLVAKTKIYSS